MTKNNYYEMKKICALMALSLALPMTMAAQTKELKPSQLYVLSDEDEREFNLGAAAFKKAAEGAELTQKEQEAYENYNETLSSYWDIVGGGDSWYNGNGGPSKIEASSRLADQGKNNYNEKNLHDLMYNTPWVEGAQGYGIGEWVKYTFEPNKPRITLIHVVNGYVKSQAAWKNNSRVKKLRLYINDKPYAMLNLDDSRSDQCFELNDTLGSVGSNAKAWTMKFEIVDVYKGDKYDDTVLSEIYFDGVDVLCFAADTKILMADGAQKQISDIAAGDNIRIYNEQTKSTKNAIVKEVESVTHQNLITYEFSDGSTVTSTSDHPFLLKDKGWASSDPANTALYAGFESAAKIEIGDEFITANGTAELTNMSVVASPQQTYTIKRLSEGSNFIANGFVVGVEMLK